MLSHLHYFLMDFIIHTSMYVSCTHPFTSNMLANWILIQLVNSRTLGGSVLKVIPRTLLIFTIRIKATNLNVQGLSFEICESCFLLSHTRHFIRGIQSWAFTIHSLEDEPTQDLLRDPHL